MIKSKQVQVVTTLGGVGWADVHSGKKREEPASRPGKLWPQKPLSNPSLPYVTPYNPLSVPIPWLSMRKESVEGPTVDDGDDYAPTWPHLYTMAGYQVQTAAQPLSPAPFSSFHALQINWKYYGYLLKYFSYLKNPNNPKELYRNSAPWVTTGSYKFLIWALFLPL